MFGLAGFYWHRQSQIMRTSLNQQTSNTTMKPNTLLTSLVIASMAVVTSSHAQEESKKCDCPKGGKRLGSPPPFLLEKFDQDGDGKLNEAERSEVKKAMKKRHEANKAKMLERFDTDKNGELSTEEKKTALPALMKERKEIRAAVIKEFDKDGDGSLNPEERKGSREWVKQNYPDAIAMPPRRAARAGLRRGPMRGFGELNRPGRGKKAPEAGGPE